MHEIINGTVIRLKSESVVTCIFETIGEDSKALFMLLHASRNCDDDGLSAPGTVHKQDGSNLWTEEEINERMKCIEPYRLDLVHKGMSRSTLACIGMDMTALTEGEKDAEGKDRNQG